MGAIGGWEAPGSGWDMLNRESRRHIYIKHPTTSQGELMSSDDDHPKFDKVKQHLKENKDRYIFGVGGVAIGVLAHRGGIPEVQQLLKIKPKQFMLFAYKCSQEMTTVVLQANGDPGDVVERLSDHKRWASKNELARDLDVARSMVTRYFNGTLPDLLGDQYVVVGKAGHPLPA